MNNRIELKRLKYIGLLMALLLMVGAVNVSWAAEVRYHILTLPFNVPNLNGAEGNFHENIRVEALLVKSSAGTVGIPDQYKSPLAKNFKYYTGWTTTTYGYLYDYTHNNRVIPVKYYMYSGDGTGEISEGASVGSYTDIYVVYQYDDSKGILLNGTLDYNISVGGTKFLCLNRSRNNRPAAANAAALTQEHLASSDFVKPAAGTGPKQIGFNWSTDQWSGEPGIHLGFKLVGNDPYNITLMTAYTGNLIYNSGDKLQGDAAAYYEPYRGATIFSKINSNDNGKGTETKMWFDSDNNLHYKSTDPANWDVKDVWPGFYRKTNYPTFNAVAILNHPSGGYVFVGSKFNQGVDNGAYKEWAPNNSGNYATFTNDNLNPILTFKTLASSPVINIYGIKNYTFKVKTPFGNEVSASIKLSEYTVDHEQKSIEDSDIPEELKRKYCSFNKKFYSDDALSNEITKYSEATDGNIYVGYNVTSDIPFKAITPAATYDASTWTSATWYELTDDGSSEESGKKITYDGANFKNNGASGAFNKTSEFTFIGDPYELRVVYRNTTTGNTVQYVGATGEPPTSTTNLTISTTATEGYKWEIPDDATAGSFRLRIFSNNNSGAGYWSWDAGNVSVDVTYGTNITVSAPLTSNPQAITLNVTGLTYAPENYLEVQETTEPTSGQVGTITIGDIATDGSATITVAIATNTSGANKAFTLTITEKDNVGSTVGTATAVNITQGTTAYAGGNVQYNTTATRVKLLTLPERTYTYKIIDKSGRVAVKASVKQTIFSPISLATVPSIIVSPFLVGETIKFYDTYTDRNGDSNLSRLDFHNPSEQTSITETPNTNHDIFVTYTTSALDAKPFKLSEDQEIFVRLNGQYIYYDGGDVKTSSDYKNTDNYRWKLRNRDPYNMLVDNMAARTALSVAGQSEPVDVYNDDGSLVDPTPSRQKGAWLKLTASLDNAVGFTFDATRANAQQFIAKSSLAGGVYEVMVATGSSIDASTTYYNIGRPADNTVKIYNNTSYAHGNDVLAFRLEQSTEYTYHLIDLAKHELLTVSSKSPELVLPAEYQSPLVATYNYYGEENITISGDEYKPTDASVKIDNLDAVYTKTSGDYSSQWTGADAAHKLTATNEDDVDKQAKVLKSTGHFYFRIGETSTYYDVNITKRCHDQVYVTYTVNDRVKFNDKSSPYMLKFLNPHADGYYLEDGKDKLIPYVDSATDPKEGRIQAVYPYCNGDGSLNIYGEAMQKEQFNGGAATRPRWIWFFESENHDPYHVMIHSSSTISFGGISHPTYLQTYAVDFVQGATTPKHIVTCGTLPTVGSEDITEYMVLGTNGQFRLKTTYAINDGKSNVRRDVTSMEQYWKTYNMIKNYVLKSVVEAAGDTYKDEFSNDEETWVVPDELRDDLEEKLDDLHVGTEQWHSYAIYANATRWNGYNDKSDGHEKKVVEKLEHWFQTFDMGDGTFDIETASVPPVLVLLDRHGWEIMRRPLPTTNYPRGKELDALRVYDSPMVDRYYFYSNATKASGCHKYTLRLQDGKERDQIKVNGVHYSSSSLGDLPPLENSTGVKSNGAFNDQYVIYTVKKEYEDSYTYNFVDNGDDTYTESGTASKFVMVQNGRFYKKRNDDNNSPSYFSKPIFEHTNPEGGNVYDLIIKPHANNNIEIVDGDKLADNCLWYVGPNLDIDEEMGIPWLLVTGESTVAKAKCKLKNEYKDKTGFDPYNIQLKNAGTGTFMTTHMTSTTLGEGIMVGNYSGSGGTTRVTLGTAGSATVSSEGYDHTNMQITNQTFMAVSDANDNMQLMPRFDHTKRLNVPTTAPNNDPWPTTLENPVDYDGEAKAEDNAQMGPQTTFFVRPQRFTYRIIDNDGNEALRYMRAGDYYPAITDHFKSPIATNFTYYTGFAEHGASATSSASEWGPAQGEYKKSVTSETQMNTLINLLPKAGTYYYQIGTRGHFDYKKVTVTKGFLDKQITGSLAEAGFSGDECSVIVRYNYDESVDIVGDNVLQGKWLTAKLAGKDLQAVGEVMKYIRLVANDEAYETAKSALSTDGVYYFKIGPVAGETPYTYKKVTVVESPASKTETTIDEDAWTTALNLVGLGVNLYADDAISPTKPATIDEDDKTWQWKFLAALADPTSDYYEEPDPYAIHLYNRNANYTNNPSLEPSPMNASIKVPNEAGGADRFVLLSHSDEGSYALAVAGTEAFTYYFVNGANMTTSVAATTDTVVNYQKTVANYENFETAREALSTKPDGVYYFKIYDGKKIASYKKVTVTSGSPDSGVASTEEEWNGAYHFTIKSGVLNPETKLVLNNDVTHNYKYRVINNGGADYVVDNPGSLAIVATQDNEAALSYGFAPTLPEEAQTPLLRSKDYKYYGFAKPNLNGTPLDSSDDTYEVIPQTVLYTLYGLYDDVVYVRYNKYYMDSTEFKVPNKKDIVDSHVAPHSESKDVSMNIEGGLPYNIIWYNDNMMSTETEDATTITDGGSQSLSGLKKYVWYFEGNDPYALKIKHKLTGNYVDGTTSLTDAAGAKQFMLLKKEGYDYGILQETGGTNKLSEYGQTTTSGDPTKFVIFGLSVHDLIYRLIIAKSCPKEEETDPDLDPSKYVDIPYRDGDESTYQTSGEWTSSDLKRIYGTTQRDLTSVNTGEGTHYPGEKYQLGRTETWGGTGHTYSYDAGTVSIGDVLEVPDEFFRPNCTFEFYIQDIYGSDKSTIQGDLNNKYKGLKLKNLMSDSELIDKTVIVNVVYRFNVGLETNAGDGFVTEMKPAGSHYLWYTFETTDATPQLAHYTYVRGMRAEEGRALHYTNDYLWSPLGDPYGFKSYNRYIYKNNNGSDQVLTTASIADSQEVVMGATGANANRDIYELLDSEKDPGGGSFRVHPLLDTGNTLFLGLDGDNKLILSNAKPAKEWTYGLSAELLNPYYQGAGNVGGLTPAAKAAYDETLEDEDAFRRIRRLQRICYNKDSVVSYVPGYYRLCNQPGASSLSPQRYASGYLHKLEGDVDKDGNESDAIPMHFYSKVGVNGTFDGDLNPLHSGFTETAATRGDIPVPATEYDPSTVFYFTGSATGATIQTQGLYVKGVETNDDSGYTKMTASSGSATSFKVDDIGGAVVILYNVADDKRHYINYYQKDADHIYDLHYYVNVDVDGSKWCMEPASTQGLKIATNNGGDGYYYATFCAPFDVQLPGNVAEDKGKGITAKDYYAYVCAEWNDHNLHPTKVPAVTGPPSYNAGKFVPAGTPVIIRTSDESGSVKLAIVGTTPSSPLPSSSNIFSGKYLEQLLPLDGGDSWTNDVYTLGLPFKSDVSKDEDYDETGDIDAPLPEQATSGLGFYINATSNKENGAMKARWDKNNRYVIHNKIYYRAGSSGASAPSVQFVPVVFDDDEGGEEEQPEETQPQPTRVGDGCVYDILGRKVASAEEVKAGTWYRHLSPGVYIVNGQKVFVGVGRM